MAQTTLSLGEAIRVAAINSRQIQLAENASQTARARYHETDAMFLPKVGIDYTAMVTNSPMQAFGIRLQQRKITQSDFAPDLLNRPGATGNFITEASLLQPLFNPDMLAMRDAARKQVTAAGFEKQRVAEFVRFSVESAYCQLQLAYEMTAVASQEKETLQSIYESVQNRFDQGYVQKSDLLNVEVRLRETEAQLSSAFAAIEEYSDELSLWMGKPLGDRYAVESIPVESPDVSITSLPEDRSDFRALNVSVSVYDDLMKATRRSSLPKINAFASYMLNDPALWGFGSGAYLAGVKLSWAIFQGGDVKRKLATHQLEKQRVLLQLADRKDQDRNGLLKAIRELTEAGFRLKQYHTAIAQAREALAILENRFRQGLATTTEVLTAQTQLSRQRLAYDQTIASRNMTLAYIRFLTAH